MKQERKTSSPTKQENSDSDSLARQRKRGKICIWLFPFLFVDDEGSQVRNDSDSGSARSNQLSQPESYRESADSTKSRPSRPRVGRKSSASTRSKKRRNCRLASRTRIDTRRVRYESAESNPTRPILRTLDAIKK